MKVKLLTPIASAAGAYNAGDEYSCASAEEAQRLVEAGVAVLIRSASVEKAAKRKPRVEKAAK